MILRHFVVGFVIICLTMVAIGFYKVDLSHKVMHVNSLVAKTHGILHESATLTVTFQDIILLEREYLLSGEPSIRNEIDAQIDLFTLHHAKLSSLTQENEEQQQRLTRLLEIFTVMHKQVIEPMLELRSLMESSPEEFVQGSQFSEKFQQSQKYTSEMLLLLDSIDQTSEELLVKEQAKLEALLRYDRILTIVGPLIILLVTFLIGFMAIAKLFAYRKRQEAYQEEIKTSRDRYSNVIEGANVGTWEWEIQTNKLSLNGTWSDTLGLKPEELNPIAIDRWLGLIHPDDAKLSQEMIQEVLSGQKELYSTDLKVKNKDGEWIWIHDQGKVVAWTEDGKPSLMTGTHTDITDRKQAQLALEASEKESRLLIDSMVQGLALCEVILDDEKRPYDVRFLKTNPRFETLLGVAHGLLAGKTLRQIMPEVEDYWIERNCEVALTGKPTYYEAYSKVLDKYFSASVYSPYPNQFATIMDDITDRKRLEQQVFYEKELFETTLLSVGDGVISTDAEAKVQFLNKAAEELTGWHSDEAKGRPFSDVFKIVCGEGRKKCPDPVTEVLKHEKAVCMVNDTILIARDGVERYIDDSASPILDNEKTIKGVVLVFRDSTEKKIEEEQIRQLSYRDSLTGLYNRRYYEQIKKTVDSEPYFPLTLVLADVNGLKLTNDAFGHDAGDLLLKTVAQVFRKTCRENDIITRIGGDEFVLLLPQTDALHAKTIVDRLNAALLKEEIRGLKVSVSFGYSVKENSEKTFEESFKVAEDGMYAEKFAQSSLFKKHAIDTLLVKQFELNQWEKEHSTNVGILCKRFAQVMGFSKEEVWQIERGASLHDLGKIAIDERILSQKEKLTPSQWLELKRHPEIGYTILRSVGEYAPFAEYVLYHHERWDGTGYPQKLKGEKIPQPARMIAIVDSFVAMISDRAYKKALTPQEAIDELHACSGTQFDPDLVHIFVEKVITPDFHLQ